MLSRKIAAIALIMMLEFSGAIACGVYFPWQLLDDRDVTLKETPVSSFFFEAEHLVPAPNTPVNVDRIGKSLQDVEAEEFKPDQLALIKTMRDAANSDEALKSSGTLPADIKFYTAGAVAFQQKDYGTAIQRFKSAQSESAKIHAPRELWATFMLGRSYARSGQTENAHKAFVETRAMAAKGMFDPMELAVASLGRDAEIEAVSLESGNDYVKPDLGKCKD